MKDSTGNDANMSEAAKCLAAQGSGSHKIAVPKVVPIMGKYDHSGEPKPSESQDHPGSSSVNAQLRIATPRGSRLG